MGIKGAEHDPERRHEFMCPRNGEGRSVHDAPRPSQSSNTSRRKRDVGNVSQKSAPSIIEVIGESIARGFSFGPRARCAWCHQKNGNPEEIDRGLCERCWSAIEAQQKPAVGA